MKKVLFVATITKHFFYFHQPCFKYFRDKGFEVSTASSGDEPLDCVDKRYEIDFRRSPFDSENRRAYKQLKRIIDEGDFDLIHCHTPVGGVLTRFAAMKARKGKTKVIYTAHGFHFYKGASLLNWCVYYPVELLFSYFTDCLITINDEDFMFAKKHLKAKDTRLINGVGYDTDRFFAITNEKKSELRAAHGYNESDRLLVYVAELNANKNQSLLIKAMKLIKDQRNDVRLLLIGPDNIEGVYQQIAESEGVSDCIEFLGAITDTSEYVQMSDLCTVSSLREGLPVNVMEALSCGLPTVAADNRGHRALVHNDLNGFVVDPRDTKAFADRVLTLLNDEELYGRMSAAAIENIKPYSKECVIRQLGVIYSEMM